MIKSIICVARLLHQIEDWICMHMFRAARRRQHRTATNWQNRILQTNDSPLHGLLYKHICHFAICFDDKFEQTTILLVSDYVAWKVLWTFVYLQGCGFSRWWLWRFANTSCVGYAMFMFMHHNMQLSLRCERMHGNPRAVGSLHDCACGYRWVVWRSQRWGEKKSYTQRTLFAISSAWEDPSSQRGNSSMPVSMALIVNSMFISCNSIWQSRPLAFQAKHSDSPDNIICKFVREQPQDQKSFIWKQNVIALYNLSPQVARRTCPTNIGIQMPLSCSPWKHPRIRLTATRPPLCPTFYSNAKVSTLSANLPLRCVSMSRYPLLE